MPLQSVMTSRQPAMFETGVGVITRVSECVTKLIDIRCCVSK
jgi:hypothetical protein